MARIKIRVTPGSTIDMVEELIEELKKRNIDPSSVWVRWNDNIAHVSVRGKGLRRNEKR